jgi:hypothetical protein
MKNALFWDIKTVTRMLHVCGVDVEIHAFFTPALAGGGQLHAPAALIWGKGSSSDTYWI